MRLGLPSGCPCPGGVAFYPTLHAVIRMPNAIFVRKDNYSVNN
jgi:hypothetical protein